MQIFGKLSANETTIVSLSLCRSVFSLRKPETSCIHLYLTVMYYFPLLCEFTARCANATRESSVYVHIRNNVDEYKGYGTRTMKSLWIARASSSRDVGLVIFNDKAMEMKWSELSKVFTIRPAHIQPQWIMISWRHARQ